MTQPLSPQASTPSNSSRRLRSALPLTLLVVFACYGRTEYTPANDAKALTTIVGVWVGEIDGKIITLNICENTSAVATYHADVDADTCLLDHTVRSAPYATIQRAHGIGCGGCPLDVVAPVTATLQHTEIPFALELGGQVVLGNGYDSNPYNLPYILSLYASGSQRLDGTITAHGRIELDTMSVVAFPNAHLPKVLYLDDSVAPVCP